MKKQTLFLGLVLGILLVSAAHNSVAYGGTATSNSRQIPLEGRLACPGKMRSDMISMTANIAPITAELQGDMILALFHTDVGAVQVTITDRRGDSVFTETVDATMQPMLIISLMGLSGNYVITFSGENVELRGEFEL